MVPSKRAACFAAAAAVTACLCVGHPAYCDGAETVFKVELRACVEGSGTIVKGGHCWVLDMKTLADEYEFSICAGLTLDAGILVAGGEASTMLCATLVVPAELARTTSDKEAWKKVAQKRMREYLASPDNQGKITDLVGGKYKDVKIRDLKAPPDDASRKKLEEAKKKSVRKG